MAIFDLTALAHFLGFPVADQAGSPGQSPGFNKRRAGRLVRGNPRTSADIEEGLAAAAVPLTPPEPTEADLAAAERAGRRAERRRLHAILSTPEAAQHWPEALMLALESPLMSAATARGVLASLPVVPPQLRRTPGQRRMAEASAHAERARMARAREYAESGGDDGAYARASAAARDKAEALGVTGQVRPTGGPTINVGGSAPRREY